MRGILPPPLAQLVALEQVPMRASSPAPRFAGALAHETRPFTDQFDVEHRRGIGTRLLGGKTKGPNAIRPHILRPDVPA